MTDSVWDRLLHDKRVYYITYSLLWLAGAAFIYCIYRQNGRNMLFFMDGIYQHFPAFSIVCDIVESLFHGKWDLSGILPFHYSIGQGVDLFTTLNSYDFADPVSWLCAAFLFLSRTGRYTAMVFMKLWLTGIAFSVFCFVTGRKNNLAVLCGALAYTFSGNVIYMFARHPNYSNWAYFLPLLLGGYELYRTSRKKRLLIFSVFFNLLVSFYTFYINTILLVVYVVVRSIAAFTKERTAAVLARELFTDLKAAGVCLIGALLCAFSLLPTIYAYLQNPRVGGLNGYTDSMLHYGEQYYRDLFVSFFAPNVQLNFTTVLGLFSVILPAVICFYLNFTDDRSGSRRALKLYGILLLIMMRIPMIGRIMNGMGYASNRWIYAVSFVAAVMLADSFERLAESPLRKRAVIVLIGAAYVFACRATEVSFEDRYKNLCMVSLIVALALYLLCGFAKKALTAALLTALTVSCIFFQSYCLFSPEVGSYISKFEKDKNHAYNDSDSSQSLSGLSTQDDFFRVESKDHTVNVDSMNKVHGTGAWWSLYPKSMFEYMSAFESNAILQNCYFEGLFTRTALLELASVRYYTAPSHPSSLPPCGYVRSDKLSDSSCTVYENPLSLPVGYSFRNFIRREEFDRLGAVQKQEAVLEGIVLEEEDCRGLDGQVPEISPGCDAYELDYTFGKPVDCKITETAMTADTAGAKVALYATVPENTELYLQIEGIKLLFPDAGNIDIVRRNRDAGCREARFGKMTNLTNNWPVQRDGITYDLGFGAAGRNQIVMVFSKPSEFSYDSIKLWAVPMDSYEARVTELRDHSLQNSLVNGKEISGTTDFDESRILQFSVPYSIGWTAYIDGQKVKLMNSDILYMAVLVPAGHHEILLRYRTPYLREGAVISLVTLLALAAASVARRRKNHL